VKALATAPTRTLADIRTAATTVLGVAWPSIEQQWRDSIMRY